MRHASVRGQSEESQIDANGPNRVLGQFVSGSFTEDALGVIRVRRRQYCVGMLCVLRRGFGGAG